MSDESPATFQGPFATPLEPLIASSVWGMKYSVAGIAPASPSKAHESLSRALGSEALSLVCPWYCLDLARLLDTLIMISDSKFSGLVLGEPLQQINTHTQAHFTARLFGLPPARLSALQCWWPQ